MPALLVASLGLAALWQRTDQAVRAVSEEQSVGLARFIATSFGTTDEARPGVPARAAHRSVTTALRSDWAALEVVTDLRIVGRDGVVRWSKRIEEEDKPAADWARLSALPRGAVQFAAEDTWMPWRKGGGGDVVYPLGGLSCGGCHPGGQAMNLGAIHLIVDEPSLRRQVSDVFTRALSSVLLFGLVLIAALAVSLRVFLARPLGKLASVMRRAEDGDLVVRAPAMGNDEIGRLAHAFNGMLARLTDLKASQIDTDRDLDEARTELQLKTQLEQTNERLRARVDEQQSLYELARTITSTLDLDEVLERITSEIPSRFEVPKFSIMLLNAEGVLEVRKAWPVGQGSEGLTFALGDGICGRAAELRRSVYVPDLEQDTVFKVQRGDGARGRGCLLAVPMLHTGELLGVLNFERATKADFAVEEIEFFTGVAAQAAMAVANARLHAQTVALSVTDPLTGAPNRRHFFRQLEAELDRATRFETPLSLLMIDIDHFKKLNDTAGHSAGDDVLREVSSLLSTNIRRVDTLARYGGEEFVVLLPQNSRADALEVAEKLRRAIAEAPLAHGASQPGGRVTISVGVATYPHDAPGQAALVDAADAALYASKRGGRNTVSGFEGGMELHPGRERGPNAQQRRASGEFPVVKP